jgi:hypothetical protein
MKLVIPGCRARGRPAIADWLTTPEARNQQGLRALGSRAQSQGTINFQYDCQRTGVSSPTKAEIQCHREDVSHDRPEM